MDTKDINKAINQIAAILSNGLNGEIMTITEQLRQQAIEQRKLDVAKKMLAEGIDVAIAAKLTGLPIDKVRQIKVH